jgi:BirA family biotin operon repressor/biotin-[acetyl-CoA-carboxylase] ligase
LAEPPAAAAWDAARLAACLAGRRLGHPLVVLQETGSTNDVAWEWARGGAGEGLLVLAECQTGGRGRGGNTWFSPPGVGVWASFLLRPTLAPHRLGLLPLVAGLAAAQAAERAGVATGLKWPNDLVAADGSGRKLGGVLCESRPEAGGGCTVVLGVGVNVCTRAAAFPAELARTAVSLAAVAGHPVARDEYLVALAHCLTDGYEALERGEERALVDAWRARAVLFGRAVSVCGGGAAVHGVARDVGEDGALIVRLDSGAELEVRAGQLDVAWENGGAAGGGGAAAGGHRG